MSGSGAGIDSGSRIRQFVYGGLAFAGLVGTWYFNLGFMGAGAGQQNYVAAWFANDASSSAAVDLLICATAAVVFILVEGRRLRMGRLWLYVVAGFVLAMAFAFPLFLLMRERALLASRAGVVA